MKRTSTVAHVYMRRHQGAKVKYFDVSNMICHNFSHGAVSYTLNGENINVMLESVLIQCCVPARMQAVAICNSVLTRILNKCTVEFQWPEH